MSKNSEPQKRQAVCFNCKKECTKDDFCHGCGKYVCSECDVSHPWGKHAAYEHLQEER